MDNYEIEVAKNYIRQRRYNKAREILLRNSDHPRAARLLNKLDQVQSAQFGRDNRDGYQTQSRYDNSQQVVLNQNFHQYQVVEKRGCLSGIPVVAMIIILLNMALWSFLIIGAFGSVDPQAGAMAAMVIIGWYFVLFILYWLHWKYYWWMLALSWTVMTVLTLCSLSNLIQFLATYQPPPY